jgi:glycosyltransferase involved in cell wall biosynthesis
VSVIVSNYNYGRFLGECIESVLAQTYANLELLVVDDGSTDDSLEVARRYERRDQRVTVIPQRNAGQAAGFNNGFARSRGEIVCFMDSDDLWMPEKVQKVVRAFGQGDYSLVQHNHTVVDEHGEPTGEVFPGLGATGDFIERYFRSQTVAGFSPTSGLACRRDCLEKVFPLDDQSYLCYYWADVAVSRPMPIFGQVYSFDEPLGYYRRHGANRSAHGPARRNEVRAQVLFVKYTNEMLRRFGAEGRIRFRRSMLYRELARTLPPYHPDRWLAAALRLCHRVRVALLRVAALLTPAPLKPLIRKLVGRDGRGAAAPAAGAGEPAEGEEPEA